MTKQFGSEVDMRNRGWHATRLLAPIDSLFMLFFSTYVMLFMLCFLVLATGMCNVSGHYYVMYKVPSLYIKQFGFSTKIF